MHSRIQISSSILRAAATKTSAASALLAMLEQQLPLLSDDSRNLFGRLLAYFLK
jgi:hypothetical protein